MKKRNAILVTGSRGWSDEKTVRRALTKQLESWNSQGDDTLLIHGGANGADNLAQEFWTGKGRTSHVYRPDYESGSSWHAAAPLIRNQKMVQELLRLRNEEDMEVVCLAFYKFCERPGCTWVGEHMTHGTRNTIGLAISAGIAVHAFKERDRK